MSKSSPTHAAMLDSSAPDVAASRPGDRHEREADAAAHSVLRGGERPRLSPAAGAGPMLARSAAQPAGAGAALEAGTRDYMEQRFGHDFSAVRVHADSAAAAAARTLGARAYTYGTAISFDAGEYRPESPGGRRLLAHELAHVVQQRGGQAMVQREPKKDTPPPATKTDVSIVLSDSADDLVEGRAYAKTVLRVTDVADAAAKLKALGVPIGRLYVVSHSNAAGKVEFNSSIGTINWVPIGDLSKALKGAVSIDDVDFRGCKTGSAPAAMESFRRELGAQSTRGSNCWTFIQHATPLTIDGVDVTQPSQIPKGRQQAFDKALLDQLANMKADNGLPVQNCLVGLGKGEKANAATLAKVWQLYWANGGNLIASWGSPDYNKDWQEGSICSKDMTADTKPCATVETRAPATATPAAGGKTGALENTQPGIDVGSLAEADTGQGAPQSEEFS